MQLEADGSSANLWVRDPDTSLRWLFKPATDSTTAPQERDWAEVVVADLAGRLWVPAAEVTLAARGRERGSLTRHLIDDEHSARQLQPGSLLLSAHVEGYVGYDQDDVRANVPGHSLANIERALRAVGAPPGGVDGISAFDHFSGYLVLDALVANTDRHARNWGLLGAKMADAQLAPSYDHGSSLGFQLNDEQRSKQLDAGIERWAKHGRAQCFDTGRPELTLVDLAADALRMAGADCRARWVANLASLSSTEVADIAAAVPRVSVVARRFVVELIETNRGRLLDVCSDA